VDTDRVTVLPLRTRLEGPGTASYTVPADAVSFGAVRTEGTSPASLISRSALAWSKPITAGVLQMYERVADLDEFAQAKISKPVRSTSEYGVD